MQRTSFWLLAIFSLLGVIYVIGIYGVLPLGATAHPVIRASFESHPPLIYSHVFLAALALLIGPTQFFTRLRTNRYSLHRWLGRIYLLSVLFGGLVGLLISVDVFGGFPPKWGSRPWRSLSCTPDIVLLQRSAPVTSDRIDDG